jgi:hypothetical protein
MTDAEGHARVFACEECGAELKLAPTRRTSACPYCKCPAVVERPSRPDRPAPALVLPFVATETAARAAVHAWARRWRWFRESLTDAVIEGIEGVYLPAYLYSAATHSSYSARIGENYTETETYTVTVNGKSETRTRTVTKTEWRSLSGEYVGYVADVLVTASRGLPNAELDRIEPFDMRLLRRYDPALISGWTTEEATLSPADGIQLARGEAVASVGGRLNAHMPGDSHGEVTYQTRVDRESLDLTVVAVWVLALRPDPTRPAKRVLVNGQTLEVWGDEKLSPVKIAIFVALMLALVGLVYLLARSSS